MRSTQKVDCRCFIPEKNAVFVGIDTLHTLAALCIKGKKHSNRDIRKWCPSQ
jgi:hypothetical protein